MPDTNQTATENASEIPADAQADAPEEAAPEIDPIEDLYHGDCLSISGRSTLTYAIGRHKETGELHLRIVENSGKGMWCDGWAPAKDIDAIVKGATELTAKSFHALVDQLVAKAAFASPAIVNTIDGGVRGADGELVDVGV